MNFLNENASDNPAGPLGIDKHHRLPIV